MDNAIMVARIEVERPVVDPVVVTFGVFDIWGKQELVWAAEEGKATLS
jgi:hypothetical protein